LEYSLLAVFTVGLVSTLHCLGMCGGIIGALSLSLPPEVQNSRWRLLPFVLSYNLGRIASYALAGALVGAVGGRLFEAVSPQYGHTILQWLAAGVMAAMGLYLAGWFPRLALLESVGQPLWRALEPLGQRLLPVQSPLHALLFGLVWGWLPCGLVYSALIYAAAAGGALQGALFMTVFGVGTLPTVAAAGILTGLMARLGRAPNVRRGAGIVVIILALASVLVSGGGDHMHHLHGIHSHSNNN
jgi:sulfite exporter TauE/SafE